MSLLFIDQWDQYVVLVSDTLVTRGKTPLMFQPKVQPLPHNNMAIATTGLRNLGDDWHDLLTHNGGLTDIESVNEVAPAILRELYAKAKRVFGEHVESSTIYHFGFPTGSEEVVCYTYRSTADFEPELFKGSRFTAKPLPADYKYQRPTSQDEVLKLALEVRDLNDEQLRSDGWGVCIGGELYATVVENWNIQTTRLLRFDDYDDDNAAIAAQ